MFVVPSPRAAPWAIESCPVGAKPRNKTHRFSAYTRFLQYQLCITPGLPYVLAARGVALVTVQEAALLLLLEPLVNPLWVWLCWGELVGWSTLVGGGLIFGGLAIRFALWPNNDARP